MEIMVSLWALMSQFPKTGHCMVEEHFLNVSVTQRNADVVLSLLRDKEERHKNLKIFRGGVGFSIVLMLALVVVVPATAGAASFSCEKASSRVEKMICADDGLSVADEELSYLFHALLSACDDKEKIRGEQLAWLSGRNRCPDAACLLAAYEERIRAIRKGFLALAAQAHKVFSTERYCSEEEVFAERGGKPEDSLGKLLVCFTVHSADHIVLVDFFVRFPDSTQRLWVDGTPAKVNKAGNLEFKFIDGWGNRGKGVFERSKSEHVLKLEMVKLMDEGDPVARNVGRMYGEYLMKLGDCRNCLNPDREQLQNLGEYLLKSQ
jgi:uncharacterized protein YecT (DUF1311 family)